MNEQRKKQDHIRTVEREYEREKQFQRIGVQGREHRYIEAIKTCKKTFGADCD